MKKYIITLSLICFTAQTITLAHDGEKHEQKDSDETQQIDTLAAHENHESHQANPTDHEERTNSGTHADHHQEHKVTADLDDFPTLHPLIVHFAIVPLIVAAVLQLINTLLIKREIAWVIFGMLAVGFAAAYFGSRNFHPHTHGLSEHAKLVLEQHDLWADWTINLSLLGLVLQGLNLFFLKTKGWALAIVAVVLLSSAYAVFHAGHYGAQLVHIEGVGPQGKFLETDHHH